MLLNKKKFLLPEGINSMAACHIKVYDSDDRKEYQMRISDCNKSIKLWGDLSDKGIEEGVEKMNNLINMANELRSELIHIQNQNKMSL